MKKSWKKLVCGLLCAALLWGSLPLQASAAWFSDVPWTAWYRRAVNELADMGIIAGEIRAGKLGHFPVQVPRRL